MGHSRNGRKVTFERRDSPIPRPNATNTAENHYGPLGIYLAAGFAVQRTDDDGSVWVRRAL